MKNLADLLQSPTSKLYAFKFSKGFDLRKLDGMQITLPETPHLTLKTKSSSEAIAISEIKSAENTHLFERQNNRFRLLNRKFGRILKLRKLLN